MALVAASHLRKTIVKTKSLRKEHLAPDERFISRVSLLNPLELDDETRSGLTTAPHLPILDIPIFEPVTQPGFRIGLMAIDGCDVLFFDVQMGRNYYCNVANPGDPEVYNAMMAWHKAGFMRARLKGSDGFNQIGRDPFEMNPVLEKAYRDSSAKEGHLLDFQERFHTLLEHGALEAVVGARTRQTFANISVGFLQTKHTDPAMPEVALNHHIT